MYSFLFDVNFYLTNSWIQCQHIARPEYFFFFASEIHSINGDKKYLCGLNLEKTSLKNLMH